MLTLPNVLSLSRFPLALAFLYESPLIRMMAIVLAMLTDVLDGHLARRGKNTSRFGAIVDPLSDKFFVIFALWTLATEQKLELWKIVAMLARDLAVITFGFYLLCKGGLFRYRVRAIWSGKVSTAMQLAALFSLVWGVMIPSSVFVLFIVLGVFAFFELYSSRQELLLSK